MYMSLYAILFGFMAAMEPDAVECFKACAQKEAQHHEEGGHLELDYVLRDRQSLTEIEQLYVICEWKKKKFFIEAKELNKDVLLRVVYDGKRMELNHTLIDARIVRSVYSEIPKELKDLGEEYVRAVRTARELYAALFETYLAPITGPFVSRFELVGFKHSLERYEGKLPPFIEKLANNRDAVMCFNLLRSTGVNSTSMHAYFTLNTTYDLVEAKWWMAPKFDPSFSNFDLISFFREPVQLKKGSWQYKKMLASSGGYDYDNMVELEIVPEKSWFGNVNSGNFRTAAGTKKQLLWGALICSISAITLLALRKYLRKKPNQISLSILQLKRFSSLLISLIVSRHKRRACITEIARTCVEPFFGVRNNAAGSRSTPISLDARIIRYWRWRKLLSYIIMVLFGMQILFMLQWLLTLMHFSEIGFFMLITFALILPIWGIVLGAKLQREKKEPFSHLIFFSCVVSVAEIYTAFIRGGQIGMNSLSLYLLVEIVMLWIAVFLLWRHMRLMKNAEGQNEDPMQPPYGEDNA